MAGNGFQWIYFALFEFLFRPLYHPGPSPCTSPLSHLLSSSLSLLSALCQCIFNSPRYWRCEEHAWYNVSEAHLRRWLTPGPLPWRPLAPVPHPPGSCVHWGSKRTVDVCMNREEGGRIWLNVASLYFWKHQNDHRNAAGRHNRVLSLTRNDPCIVNREGTAKRVTWGTVCLSVYRLVKSQRGSPCRYIANYTLLFCSFSPSFHFLAPNFSSTVAISISIHRRDSVGGVNKASGCSPHQLAYWGWLWNWTGHLHKQEEGTWQLKKNPQKTG